MDNEQGFIQSIVVELENEEYAIPVEFIGGIERIQQITRVPKTTSFIKGVINLRGVITPIIDLRERFGLSPKEHNDSTRIIIAEMESFNVGFIVDAAYDVVNIPNEAIEPNPKVIGTKDIDYIDGVAKVGNRLLMLLNLERTLSHDNYQIERDQDD
ncbi:purine-binding chemotaxis protein CheW [Gracilibacillus halotolerans]|uniref:Chemotaxis protein CheW n=1 Tax=Gracilibacillus halotolerans TaxID=74386 RepID=A0A841RC15_9BACI|nr:chemotaxis protein CheW [Gracilibacillus halotolerans]MBB6511460.1 purine-binding chemotaxis protein CheW [Gracilibacillus halotolerans]